MKISLKELKKLIKIEQTTAELSTLLTNTGLEVEGLEEVEQVKGGLKGLVIGEVLTIKKHENADSLNVTTVDIGAEEPVQIVCGAKNVDKGQKVIVATVGATLYPVSGDSFAIKKAKIRGEASFGMICAEDEIGMGASHDGIMVLDTDLPNGTPASIYFNLESDTCIEIGLTPNRADAASHFGVARDIKAINGNNINLPSVEAFKLGANKGKIEVEVINKEACKRFCGLEITDVAVSESPNWLKLFLTTIGLKPINNLVDITNYINHFIGQPMHIFDADTITGNKIEVKTPEKDTLLTTLDGIERKLSGFDLAICNAQEPMAIAGVFGGEKTGVSSATKNIFLEVAYFDPSHIRKTAAFHSLKTDASFKYERGTDPNMPPYAIKLAALMIKELAGGEIADSLIDICPNEFPDFPITLSYRRVNRLIGKSIEPVKIKEILTSLDIKIKEETAEGLELLVPPFRVDVTREADVIEEILRIYGFDNIQESDYLKAGYISDFKEVSDDSLRLKISQNLAANGFNEIQTLSITKPAYNVSFEQEEVKLLNPLSEELSVMRKSLLVSGLESLAYNVNRQNKDLRFFEFGRIYFKANGKYKDSLQLGLWLTGKSKKETWATKSEKLVFSDLKQEVDKVLAALGFLNLETEVITNEAFQYGLSYKLNNSNLVNFGAVSKKMLKLAGLKQDVFYAEFNWELISKKFSLAVQFTEIPKFPEVRRDLSLVLDKNVTFDSIKKIALKTDKKLLKTINVFDVYEGKNIEEGKKSYSVSFTLQDPNQTLADKQIDKVMEKLIYQFENQLNAIIRK